MTKQDSNEKNEAATTMCSVNAGIDSLDAGDDKLSQNLILDMPYVTSGLDVKEFLLGFLAKYQNEMHRVYDGDWYDFDVVDILRMMGCEVRYMHPSRDAMMARGISVSRIFCYNSDLRYLLSLLAELTERFYHEEANNKNKDDMIHAVRGSMFGRNPLTAEEMAEKEKQANLERERKTIEGGGHVFTFGEQTEYSSPIPRHVKIACVSINEMEWRRAYENPADWPLDGVRSVNEEEQWAIDEILQRSVNEPYSSRDPHALSYQVALFALEHKIHLVQAVRDVLESPDLLAQLFAASRESNISGLQEAAGFLRNHPEPTKEAIQKMWELHRQALNGEYPAKELTPKQVKEKKLLDQDFWLTGHIDSYLASIAISYFKSGDTYANFLLNMRRKCMWEFFCGKGKSYIQEDGVETLSTSWLNMLGYHVADKSWSYELSSLRGGR